MTVKNTNTRIDVTISKKDVERLQRQAKEFGFSMSRLALIYILDGLKTDEHKK